MVGMSSLAAAKSPKIFIKSSSEENNFVEEALVPVAEKAEEALEPNPIEANAMDTNGNGCDSDRSRQLRCVIAYFFLNILPNTEPKF